MSSFSKQACLFYRRDVLAVADGLLVVTRFQFDPDCASAVLERNHGLRSDSEERRQNDVAGIAPQIQSAADHRQLKRADVSLVLFVSRRRRLQRVGRVDVRPDRRGVFLPDLDRKSLVRMAHGLWIVSGLPHRDKVIRDALSAHAAVLFELLVQQADRLCALHGDHWIFPNADLRMQHKAGILKQLYQLSAEVTQTDDAVALLAEWQIHAVERNQPAGDQNTEQLVHDEFELLVKLRCRAAVAEVTLAVGAGIQRVSDYEWGTIS